MAVDVGVRRWVVKNENRRRFAPSARNAAEPMRRINRPAAARSGASPTAAFTNTILSPHLASTRSSSCGSPAKLAATSGSAVLSSSATATAALPLSRMISSPRKWPTPPPRPRARPRMHSAPGIVGVAPRRHSELRQRQSPLLRDHHPPAAVHEPQGGWRQSPDARGPSSLMRCNRSGRRRRAKQLHLVEVSFIFRFNQIQDRLQNDGGLGKHGCIHVLAIALFV